MASQGKKGKKNKGKTLNLTDFLADDTQRGDDTTTVVVAPQSSWADEMDEQDYYSGPSTITKVVLPTAPRAARGPDISDDKIPTHPPFTAYIANLPYDCEDADIMNFFSGLSIQSVRLVRDGDPESGRLKGYGYADFEDRHSLIEALTMTDRPLRNRNIRVDLATQSGKDRGGFQDGGGRRNRNYDQNDDEDRTLGDWRSGPPPETRSDDRYERRGYDRGGSRYGRYDDNGFGGGGGGFRDDRRENRGFGYDRYERRDDFDRSQMRRDDNRDRYDDRRDRFGDDRRDRYDNRGFGDRRGDRYGDRRGDRYSDERREAPRERPKLQLSKRTAPVEEAGAPSSSSSIFGGAKPIDTSKREQEMAEKLEAATIKESEPPKGATNADIFGSAKPVDTAAKEREIEEKLKRQQEEARERGDAEGTEERKPPMRIELPSRDRNGDRDRPVSRGSGGPRRDGPPPGRRDGRRDYDRRDRDYDRRDDRRNFDRRDDRDRRDSDRRDDRRDFGRRDRDSDRDRDRRSGDNESNGDRKRPERSPPALKKAEETKPPNFAASNKFSSLADEDDNATGTSGQDSE